MRSCSMALQLLSTALGSYLGGGVVAVVQSASTRAGAPWLPKDLNQGAPGGQWLVGARAAAAWPRPSSCCRGRRGRPHSGVLLFRLP
jgi:hypothetical protein